MLSAAQVVSAIRPPLRHSRASSARRGFGAAGEHDPERRNHGIGLAVLERKAHRRRQADESIGSRVSAAALARAAACQKIARDVHAGDRGAARRAATLDVQPVPVDRSRIRWPGRGSSRITQCSIASAMPRLI